MRLLPPEMTAVIGRLELLARSKKEGSITGRHASPHKGFSVEFAEHRQYTQGDDLRDLDWRVYGRSDRYYIKQYVEETNLRATIVLDASGSMAYQGRKAASLGKEQLTKYAYARYLAASLAYLMIQQQDSVGLVTFDRQIRAQLRSVSRPSQVRLILEEMSRTEPGEDTEAAEVFHEVAERIPRRGLVLLFSDLFDDGEAIQRALHHFRYRNHELIVFHLMAEEELEFPFKKFTAFRDLEGVSPNLKIDPLALRAQYLERVQTFVRGIEQSCGQMKADYVPITTSKPVPEALSQYLSGRRDHR
ncbi:MAG: DUF58 domain-containing protein [Verrucomicrobiota bacterium]